MKKVGIIAEFNPLTDGHKYIIKEAKLRANADSCVIVMSPDFVERGEPAIFNKFSRAKCAISAGADAIFAMPVEYATASAEYFANCGVSMLYKLGIKDIAFGCEYDDLNLLYEIAHVLIDEPDDFKVNLQENLKNGLSFGAARAHALIKHSNAFEHIFENESPNTTLAIEYIKSAIKNNYDINFIPIKRIGADYNSNECSGNFDSASAVRTLIRNLYLSHNNLQYKNLKDMSADSENTCENLENFSHDSDDAFENVMSSNPVFLDDFTLLLKEKLLLQNSKTLTEYFDIDLELANSIMKYRFDFNSTSNLILKLKTKNRNYSKISRALIHILLNIKKENVQSNSHIPYYQLLGINKNQTSLLSEFNAVTKAPIIASKKDADKLEDDAKQMFKTNLYASLLYESVYSHKFNKSFVHEFEHKITI